MAQLLLALVLVFLQILGIDGGEPCYQYSYTYGYDVYHSYCQEGCCGSIYNQECCEDLDEDDVNVGLIIGAVIGGIIFLGFTVSLICGLVCMGMKMQGNRGRVIVPLQEQQGATNMAQVSTHANWAQTRPYPSQQPVLGPPTGYSQYGQPSGTFPQPPPYEHQHPPSSAPPEYPTSSDLYNPLPSTGQGLPPISGTSAQQLPPINHSGVGTSKV